MLTNCETPCFHLIFTLISDPSSISDPNGTQAEESRKTGARVRPEYSAFCFPPFPPYLSLLPLPRFVTSLIKNRQSMRLYCYGGGYARTGGRRGKEKKEKTALPSFLFYIRIGSGVGNWRKKSGKGERCGACCWQNLQQNRRKTWQKQQKCGGGV